MRLVLLLTLFVASGCGDDRSPLRDAGPAPDAGLSDAGADDAGPGACEEGFEACETGCCPVETGRVYAGDVRAPSIAIDATGRPHVSFLVDAYSLHYGRLDGGWSVETIDDPTYDGVSQATSIAIDPSGDPLVAYEANYSLRLARPGDGAWQHEIVYASSQGFGPSVSQQAIALDTGGTPQLVSGQEYYQTSTYGSRVQHFAWDGTEWPRAVVESYGDNRITMPTIAMRGDVLGVAWVSYYDGVLRYASNATGEWVTEAASNDAGCCESAFLALAPDGAPRIVFRDSDRTHGIVERDATGAWRRRALTDSLGGVGEEALRVGSVAVDPSGVTHYTYGRGEQLVYVVEDASPPTAVVVAEGVSDHMLVLDGDRPHLVYTTSEGLHYASP